MTEKTSENRVSYSNYACLHTKKQILSKQSKNDEKTDEKMTEKTPENRVSYSNYDCLHTKKQISSKQSKKWQKDHRKNLLFFAEKTAYHIQTAPSYG